MGQWLVVILRNLENLTDNVKPSLGGCRVPHTGKKDTTLCLSRSCCDRRKTVGRLLT